MENLITPLPWLLVLSSGCSQDDERTGGACDDEFRAETLQVRLEN